MLDRDALASMPYIAGRDNPVAAGRHAGRFDGAGLASGAYICRLTTQNQVATRLMMPVR
ncbi:MAG TPA: hypothetical protein VLT13_09920 [Bacteroidota bacterium]|nr:hypothetical protein [Bacteroidota bacterium]